MSIKRCPYCKAIVDDSSEYCASCGTKLLFPEDEIKGENVPGEIILDDIPDPDEAELRLEEEEAPVPEEEENIEPDEETSKEEDISEGQASEFEEVYSLPEEDSRNIDVELQKLKYISDEGASWDEVDLPSGEEKEEPDESLVPLDELTGEVEDAEQEVKTDEGGIEDSVYHMQIKEDEDEAIEKDVTSSKSLPEILPDSTDFDDEKENSLPLEEVSEEQAEADDFSGPEVLDDPDELDESSEDEAADYRAGDQMSIFDPVEKEKEDIERFLKSLRKERRGQKPDIPETGTGLPPWAKKIQKEEITDAEEKAGDDEPESGKFESVDLDERDLDQPEEFIETDENESESPEINILETETPEDAKLFEPVEDEEPEVATESERVNYHNLLEMESTPGGGLARWIKRRIADVLLVGIVWFIALVLASFVMDKTVLQLIRSSALTVFLFLGVLIIQYFFLFYFFLGSTLGDRLFPRKD